MTVPDILTAFRGDSVVTVSKSHPGILLARINRPERHNAIDSDVTQAIARIVEVTEADADVRVVVLCAAGDKSFCAGADLSHIAAHGTASLVTARGGFAGFVYAERATPWIAAVDGPALGGGCELALACDMIVASEGAEFGLAEVRRGLAAFGGGMFRLPRALPPAIANELLATGGTISASRAYALGMVNRLAPRGTAVDQATALARRILESAPLSVTESLRIARKAHDLDEPALIALSRGARDRLIASADAREGVAAFIEKRPAVWRGA